jgi:RNA polymerase sigma-70 factor, ECF subfamily
MTLGATFDTTLTAARTGAEWAWTLLYRDTAPALLRYLRARGARDPENIVGEVFVQVVRKLPEFRGGEAEFRAWLFTIARNRLTDEVRRRTRRHEEPAGTARLEAVRPADAMSGDSSAFSSAVWEMLNELTPEQRDVLFLRVLAGLTLEETAQVLGKTSGSVKRLQARGLKALRKKVADGVVSF